MTGRVPVRVLAGAAAAFLALAPTVAAGAAPTPTPTTSATSVKLPTESDALAVAVNIERLLNGSRGIETRLPGPVADDELVAVKFGPDGKLVAVSDDQRLHLSGLGDFEFKVAGPATDVEALPGSESEPGLRRGSVIWQGFSDGSKSIGARMSLIPGQEEVRIPVRVQMATTVDGRPVEAGHTYSGKLRLRMTVTNNSPVPIQVVDGDIGLEEGAAILDRLRSDLQAGRRPAPGEGGIPESIQVTNPAFRQATLEAPARVEGTVALPGRATVRQASGIGQPTSSNVGLTLPFQALLGGGSPLSHTVDVTADVRGLRVPMVAFTAVPASPSAESLKPPAGATWTDGLRTDPAAFDPHAMTGLIMDTLWRTARLRQFDAYLGDPDPTGPAATRYRFSLTTAVAAARPDTAAGSGGLLRAVAGAGVAIALALGAVVVWSRS